MARQDQKWGRGAINIWLVGLVFFLAFLIMTNLNLYLKDQKLLQRLNSLNAEISKEESRQQAIRSKQNEINEPDFMEKTLREKGMYKKQGEEVVVILKPQASSSSDDQARQGKKAGFFAEMWASIKSIFR